MAKQSGELLINLAFLSALRTGLAVYATNLLPHLRSLDPLLLSSQPIEQFRCHTTPTTLTQIGGTRSHAQRLVWTQLQLPRVYRQQQGTLLFSPVPETPIFSNVRSVVMVHDLIPLHFAAWKSPLKAYFRYYVPLVLQHAQHIICNSQATAEDMVRFYGIAASRITPIPLAIDAQHFQPLTVPTQNYFLYLGRCDPYKNVSRAIAAFAQLPHGKDYEFRIVGPDDPRYLPDLKSQAEALGVAERVQFLGYRPYHELPQLLAGAIALVFPSLWEGFGFPVLEAMACGTPVITSNLSSLPEVAGDAALMVNPYQVEEIAAAMKQVLDEGVRSHLRAAGLSQVARFSWEKTGYATAEVLRQFL